MRYIRITHIHKQLFLISKLNKTKNNKPNIKPKDLQKNK